MLARHMKREDKFKCPHCEYATVLRAYLRKHLINKHQKIEPDILCSVCAKKFYSVGALNSHIKLKHNRNGSSLKFPCKLCEKDFPSEFKLHNHMKFVHPDEEARFPCKTCSNKFYTESYLEHHVKTIHLNKVKCQDELCDAVFHSKIVMKNHFATVHLKHQHEVS